MEPTLKLHPQPVGNSFDALCPYSLVEFRVESNIGCAHCFSCKLDDRFDCPRGSLFEGTTVDALV